jgi:hypothetical protein
MKQTDKAELISELNGTVERFISLTLQHPPSIKVTDEWNIADIVRHITYWHLVYLSIIEALSDQKEPVLLDGKYTDLNHAGVASLQEHNIQKLSELLRATHRRLMELISTKTFSVIPYKKGARTYNELEYLNIINSHINSHSKAIRLAIRKEQRKIGTKLPHKYSM